jgi:hypothetical protein
VIDRCITILRRFPHLIDPQQGRARLNTSVPVPVPVLAQVMDHSLALALDLRKLHSHVHVHVVFHPLPREVLVQVDRSFGIVMVVGIAYYSVLSHQPSLVGMKILEESEEEEKERTYDEEYVVESYLGYRTAVGVLLGLDLGDGYLDYGSCDVVGDCSFLVPDRAYRVV